MSDSNIANDWYCGYWTSVPKYNFHMKYGVGIRGCLPRGAYQKLHANQNIVRIYMYIYTHPNCILTDIPMHNLNSVYQVSECVSSLISFKLVKKSGRIYIKNGMYKWTLRVNEDYVDSMIAKFGQPEEWIC